MGHGSITKKKRHFPHAASRQDFMGRCREGALVLGGGEVVKVSSDKDCSGILHGQGVTIITQRIPVVNYLWLIVNNG